jgi:hypothetical protein
MSYQAKSRVGGKFDNFRDATNKIGDFSRGLTEIRAGNSRIFEVRQKIG